ncbi:hypothetical protein Syun_010372 [Stephania yunnanensis]|uniref:Uncharacterized protein n=1 Tax=Stephania yunnanensis TaxID=152371 RepID=A0AAP0PPK2_9MAGN
MAISDNAFQADQNENMDIVEVDLDPLASAAVYPTSEVVSNNDEFETNADDEEDDEFTSSSDSDIDTLYMARDGGRGNPEDEDMEDNNRHLEETSTSGRGSLSHHATHAHSDCRNPYPYQYDTPSPPVHALPAKHGIIPSSSYRFTPSPPADGRPHDHGIRSSSSHHATPSPLAHPAHSPGVGDEHTSTSRRPPTSHRHSSARSSSNRLCSSIQHAIEEIPDFFIPLKAPAVGENPLIYLIAEHSLLHPSSVAAGKVFFTWDLRMSFAIYDAWCQKAAIRYMGNIYLIAKKRIAPIYLTDEVFEHYKRMRAKDEAFKKKSEQMNTNRKSEVGGPGTCMSLHSAGSISARHHGDTLAELTQRLEEMSTQTPNTSIDEDVIYLEVVPEVRGRVYGLGSQGCHHSISLGEASSSRGQAYGLHELEELQRDHQRLQETLLKERMERQEQMQRDKMERQEENREMQDRLARMEALLMQHLGIRPHVPPTPRTPPSPVTERSGPQSDDQPNHSTTEIAP